MPNQCLRRLRKKIHPIYSLKKTAGECALSGPGKDHVWPELQPCLQNKSDSITMELKEQQNGLDRGRI